MEFGAHYEFVNLFPSAQVINTQINLDFILDLVMNLSARPDMVVPLWPITALERSMKVRPDLKPILPEESVGLRRYQVM